MINKEPQEDFVNMEEPSKPISRMVYLEKMEIGDSCVWNFIKSIFK